MLELFRGFEDSDRARRLEEEDLLVTFPKVFAKKLRRLPPSDGVDTLRISDLLGLCESP